MADKQIKTRIQQKHDVAANWAKATNFIPKKGEIIIYEAEYNASGEETQAVRFKIGDGSKTVNNLPFAVIDYGSDIEALEQEVADNSTAIGKIQGAFESNSTTAKKATSAGTADKVANGLTLQGSGAYELNKITFDGSGQQSIAFGAGLLTVHANGEANQLYVDTEDSGVTPGTYNKVTVNKKGCVTTAENVDYAKKSDIPDISGKANLAGGNQFTGAQEISRDDTGLALDIVTDSVNLGTVFGVEKVVAGYGGDSRIIIDGDSLHNVELKVQGNAGTAGQVLTSQGAGKTPTWATPSGGATDAVKYTAQTLTTAQKAQARTNIGAGTGNGTVKSVKINGSTKSPDGAGLVDLGTISGGGDSVASVVNLKEALIGGDEYTIFSGNETGYFTCLIGIDMSSVNSVNIEITIGSKTYTFVPTQSALFRIEVETVRYNSISADKICFVSIYSNSTTADITKDFFICSDGDLNMTTNLGSSYQQYGTGVLISKEV